MRIGLKVILVRARMALVAGVGLVLFAFSSFVLYVDPLIITVSPIIIGILVVSALISRRFLSPARKELASQLGYIAVGLYSLVIGILFWRSFDTVYETSPWLNIPRECCGIDPTPTLPSSIALVPWLLILVGSLTMLLAVLRRGAVVPLAILSLGLVLASTLPDVFFGFGDGTGWPLAWWGHTFSSCAFCIGPPIGYAIVLPFLLNSAFWCIMVAVLVLPTRMLATNPSKGPVGDAPQARQLAHSLTGGKQKLK